MSVPRWVCHRCGVNNMPQSGACFKCGELAPAPAPAPVMRAPEHPPWQIAISQNILQPPLELLPPPEPKTDVCAILSVVFGGISFAFFCIGGWFFSVVGGILGIVSLCRLYGNPRLTGTGMAITGLVLSVATPIIFAVWLNTLAAGISQAAQDRRQRQQQQLPPPPNSSQPAAYPQ